MHFLSSATTNGVTERDFVHDGVPGVLWTPAGTGTPAPLVLGAHGGGQHKRAPRPAAHAARCVAAGMAVVTLDAPGHGDRPRSAEDDRFIAEIRSRMTASQEAAALVARREATVLAGEDAEALARQNAAALAGQQAPVLAGRDAAALAGQQAPVLADRQAAALARQEAVALVAEYGAVLAERAVPEWRSVLDAVLELPEISSEAGADGRVGVGFWGMSMGSAIGIPLVAAEPRVRAAVFGLVGATEGLARAAAGVTVPLRFLLQWEDDLIRREAGLAMFDAFGSRHKTLHANPGGHGDVPEFETDSAVEFLSHLLVRNPRAPHSCGEAVDHAFRTSTRERQA